MKSKIKVLIVDDSVTSRTMIAKHLSDSYECLMAGDGEEAWDILLSDESITLVFADMHMPVLNGMLLLKRIRDSDIERIASIPVIIITGREDSDVAKRASYNIGATDFISKPFVKSEILCSAGSFTRHDRANTAVESDIAKEVLNGLHDNAILAKFGSKTIAYSERHDTHTAVMYVQIAHVEELIETHGSKLISKLTDSIYSLLEESLREEEIISAVGMGKYAIVLPGTSVFKANIVATRLRQAVDRLSFQYANETGKCSLAIGITSTESCDAVTKYLTFGEYCIQAQHALNMSLESRSNHIVRFDETYEKRVQQEPAPARIHHGRDLDKNKNEVINMLETNNIDDLFSDILTGDYSKIPDSCLDMMVEPLEKFLEHAKDVGKQAGIKKTG